MGFRHSGYAIGCSTCTPCLIAWLKSQLLCLQTSYLLMHTQKTADDGSNTWNAATHMGDLE